MGVHTSVYDANMQLPTTPDYLKAAGVKSLRYPGGSYADLYHWSKHTGTYTPAVGAGSNTIFVAPDTNFGAFLLFMEKVGANALITVNYGMNSLGTGGGEPKEAAAWVAYANGSPSSTVSIGADSKGTNWQTVAVLGEPARRRAAGDRRRPEHVPHQPPGAVRHQVLGGRQRALRQRLVLRRLRLGSRHARPLPGDGEYLHGPHGQRGAVAGGVRRGREGVRAGDEGRRFDDQDRRHRRRPLRDRIHGLERHGAAGGRAARAAWTSRRSTGTRGAGSTAVS